TLTITRTGTANNSTAVFPDGSLTIRPETPGGTGRVVFRDVRGTINGVILSLASAATVNITGADFINTYQPTSPAGVFYIYNAGASLTLTDFLADGNSAGNTGFARITTGTLIMNDGIIRNSYTRTMTTSGHTGALGIYGTGAKTVEINRVLFEGNRTFDAGGAIKIGGANDATVANFSGTFTNAVFKDNWAAGRGGAVISAHMNGDLVFKMAAAGGATQYHYTGNAAYGNADAAVFTAAMLAANNTGTHAAAASAGGFYYASSASPAVLKFDIDPGVSLTIGDADDTGNDKDSIVGTTAHTLKKTGGGDLILTANNSFWRGAVEVSGGRLLLGREAALLGGSAITVGPGATLGGSGTLTTAGAPGAASVVAGPGATIQIGLAGRMTEKLVIDGTLSLTDAILSFVAFGGTHAATLEVTGSLIASGSNTVNIQSFNTGIYNLGQLKSPLADSATVSLTINGAAQVAGGRQIATWVDHATDLIVDYSADASRLLKWTGLSGTAWNSAEASWQGVNTPAVTQYAAGDFVQFPGDAPGDLSIAIDDPVQITGMDVSGAGAIVFSGAGGITATAWQGGGPDDEDAVKAGTGRLVKNGSGALVFANDGANVFNGGIEINGGVIEFSHGRQIQTGAGAIVAGQSGTLRAGDSTAVENHIQIGPGRSLVFDTGANAVTQAAGGISGAGTFIKIGTGTLALNVANTAPVELCAGVLALGHGGAIGGGLAVTGGGSLDAAGGLAVRGGISIGVPALNIKNTGGAAAVFSGPIVGASAALSVFGRIGFSGANTFAALSVKPGAVLTAGGAGALGGAGADVTVENGATLNLGALEVAAGSLTVRGGATLGFADLKATAAPFLRVTGALALENSSTLAIVNAPSRRIWLASAAGGVTDGGASIVITGDGAQSDVLVDIRDGDLRVTHVNLSANPGKDIAVAFDAVSAAAGAIHARLDEGFLSPFMERREGGPGRGLWLKGAGSFADYDGDSGRIGHRDRIYGGVVGLDKVFGERLLLGAVLGWAGAEIKTDNHAATDADIYSAGVYGSLKLGPFYFTADFLLGTLAADTSRPEGFAGRANGSYKGTVAGAGAGVGLVLPLWKNATLRPSAEMHRLSFDFRDHGEGYNAGGLQGLVILDDFRAVRWEGLVNLRFSQGFTLPWKLPGALDLLAGWRSSLADDDPVVLGAAFAADLDDRFAITSDEYGRDRFAAGLALRLGLTRRAGLVLAAEHEFIEHGSRDSFAASVRWSW
ncbi:MAG: autotransporter domain-containing protein, partial [Opitutaceae bacterium]|nr:autotransporter domain-containing protein [Opitutaceae bacterium]